MSVVLFTVLSSFIASAVEFVEALTVVLAVGVTRQWRSTLLGAGAAVVVLIALIGVLGVTIDWISFTVAFKGVLLEGLEVAFIVITFGVAGGQLVPALTGAALAGICVLSVGVAVRRPLARLPENQLKFGVGLMLVSFGTFWAGEGIGIAWPGSDLAILLLLVGYLATSLLAVRTVAAGLVKPGQPIAMHARQEAN